MLAVSILGWRDLVSSLERIIRRQDPSFDSSGPALAKGTEYWWTSNGSFDV